jgi:hypothetical protein
MMSDKQEMDNINEAIILTNLSESHKKILILRLNVLLKRYSVRSKIYSITFNTLRITITVGSLIVPALLSVQTPVNNTITPMNVAIYWVVWVISLLVTISNGCVTLLKVDKKYYNLNTSYQHFISETWQFIELSGKYSGYYTPGQTPSHENQYIYFCSILEKIQMKNIEDEYYKITEHSPVKNLPISNADSLIPPTPLKIVVDQNSPDKVNGSDSTPNETYTTVRRIEKESS